MIGKQAAVFFDRDGVLNVDHGYTYRPEDFQWMPGAVETIKYFNERNYLVIVITNQSGVARGYYTEEDVNVLHEYMNVELKKQGAHVDCFYYCPHHPEGKIVKYKSKCNCRKPAPGMLMQAMEEWPINKEVALVIGDKPSDVVAAEAAGVKGYLFAGENLLTYIQENII
jgi:D-glycero-D-manno-heptose 1,7-bisphosphate phosphatase